MKPISKDTYMFYLGIILSAAFGGIATFMNGAGSLSTFPQAAYLVLLGVLLLYVAFVPVKNIQIFFLLTKGKSGNSMAKDLIIFFMGSKPFTNHCNNLSTFIASNRIYQSFR